MNQSNILSIAAERLKSIVVEFAWHHEYLIAVKLFPYTGPLWGESIDHWCIPLIKVMWSFVFFVVNMNKP